MIVENRSGRDLPIPELRRVVPANGKRYVVPYNVAVKYKNVLTPIQMSNNMVPPSGSTPPLGGKAVDAYKPQPEANVQMTDVEKQAHMKRLADMLGENVEISITNEPTQIASPMKFVGKPVKKEVNPNILLEENKKPSANKGKTREEILAKAESDKQLIIATYKEGTCKSMYAISKALGFSPMKVKAALDPIIKGSGETLSAD